MTMYIFFGVYESQKAKIDDPNTGSKRDVVVYFFDKDLFCDALRKNGGQMISYTFDAVYNPYAPLSWCPLVIYTNCTTKTAMATVWVLPITRRTR